MLFRSDVQAVVMLGSIIYEFVVNNKVNFTEKKQCNWQVITFVLARTCL